MLVLSRKSNQSILIGNTEVTLVSIKNKRASLGITAPREVPIARGEVLQDREDLESNSWRANRDMLDCALRMLGYDRRNHPHAYAEALVSQREHEAVRKVKEVVG